MSGRTPRPYVNDVKQDDALMRYVNDGDFSKLGIGGRAVSLPKSGIGGDKMAIDHVGKNATNGK